jgi:signal transduction histidine kinase
MTNKLADGFEEIPFGMHPRVFASLGADLVTNDTVAIIELVKNSYDAFASNVWVRFATDPEEGTYIEIEDDGVGMTEKIIREVWAVVATPYKEKNPFSESGNTSRRVSGQKGLGRLSAARLGQHLHMLTQPSKKQCFEVKVDWDALSQNKSISSCSIAYRECAQGVGLGKCGTRIKIMGLRTNWDSAKISDLKESLSRLVSPFAQTEEFNIFFISSGGEAEEVKIDIPDFLKTPKYQLKGKVDSKGNITTEYRFTPVADGEPRSSAPACSWADIFEGLVDPENTGLVKKASGCGPFSFELRAWDMASDDLDEIAQRFEFQKSKVRKSIRMHKGISVYRDGILILPKSENMRDWLGLDLRRVSKVGSRLSTSQIVGYVGITVEGNPEIKDTSDRERLASGPELSAFELILKAAVEFLENERNIDRLTKTKVKPMQDLFGQISGDQLVSDMKQLEKEGAKFSDAISLARTHSAQIEAARDGIQERFIYYSRLATVGTIAEILVHEIRNRTTAFGAFIRAVWDKYNPFKDRSVAESHSVAVDCMRSLEHLADTFAPLASRNFKRGKRSSILEERIRICLDLEKGNLDKNKIRYILPNSKTEIAMDPGELDAVLLNLITNAIHWLVEVEEERIIEFSFDPLPENRIKVWVHDNGPGIAEEDRERVFWPGFTRKTGGIGMGLTVASELIAEYGGKMFVADGVRGGASFGFDVPLRKG